MADLDEAIEAATWALIDYDTDVADRGVRDEHYRERRADVDRVLPILAEAVRQEERERYDPAKDERLVRYMAMVTPLGYATATAAVEAMTQLIDVERRAEQIAEQARQKERARCAQIAEEVATEGNDYEAAYCRGIAARIREQGR